MKIKQLKQIVDNLNYKIWGEDADYEENFQYSFSFQYATSWESILFQDNVLWHSENDEREWLKENNDYEDLEKFYIKQFCKLGNELLILNKLLLKK